MKLEGSAVLPGKRRQVWDLLNDPGRLGKLLPGCEELIPAGEDRYQVKVKFGIAAISGNFSGTVALSEKKPPHSLRMKVDSKGVPGFMTGEGKLELAEKGGQTEVRYTGEVKVGGMIAAVGNRMIEATARRILQQFFDNAARELGSSSAGA